MEWAVSLTQQRLYSSEKKHLMGSRAGLGAWENKKSLVPVRNRATVAVSSTPLPSHYTDYANPALLDEDESLN